MPEIVKVAMWFVVFIVVVSITITVRSQIVSNFSDPPVKIIEFDDCEVWAIDVAGGKGPMLVTHCRSGAVSVVMAK